MRLVEATFAPGMTVSLVARQNEWAIVVMSNLAIAPGHRARFSTLEEQYRLRLPPN